MPLRSGSLTSWSALAGRLIVFLLYSFYASDKLGACMLSRFTVLLNSSLIGLARYTSINIPANRSIATIMRY